MKGWINDSSLHIVSLLFYSLQEIKNEKKIDGLKIAFYLKAH